MIPWKYYLDDGSTFVGEWINAPTHGGVCCVVLDKTGAFGRFIVSGYAPHHARTEMQYYVCYPDSTEPYITGDLASFKDRMKTLFADLDVNKFIKFGRQIDQLNWQKIMDIAANDKDFPTATSPRRRATDFPPVE